MGFAVVVIGWLLVHREPSRGQAPARIGSAHQLAPPSAVSKRPRRRFVRQLAITAGAVAALVGFMAIVSIRPTMAISRWGVAVFGVLGIGFLVFTLSLWRWPAANGGRRSRFYEQAGDAAIALVVSVVAGTAIFAATEDLERRLLDAQEGFEESRFERDVRRDNVRFVREVATQPEPASKPFAGLDLREAPLSGLNLAGADFCNANLRGANLESADLSGATLSGDVIRERVLPGGFSTPVPEVVGADLRRAELDAARLVGADLVGADLRRADLGAADLTRAWLMAADLTGVDLHASVLADANLEYANLTGVDLHGAVLNGAKLSGARLSNIDGDADLTAVILVGAELVDVDLSEGRLQDANLIGATFENVDLTNANLRNAMLLGVDLRDAELSGADLTGAQYDHATTWPEGFTPPPLPVLTMRHDDRSPRSPAAPHGCAGLGEYPDTKP